MSHRHQGCPPRGFCSAYTQPLLCCPVSQDAGLDRRAVGRRQERRRDVREAAEAVARYRGADRRADRRVLRRAVCSRAQNLISACIMYL